MIEDVQNDIMLIEEGEAKAAVQQNQKKRKDSEENDKTRAVIKEHLIEEQKIKIYGKDEEEEEGVIHMG